MENPQRVDFTRQCIQAVLGACMPDKAIERNVRFFDTCITAGEKSIDLPADGKLLLVSIGKAANGMAGAFCANTKRPVDAGIIVTKSDTGYLQLSRGIQVYRGDHPVPGHNSHAAGEMVTHFLRDVKKEDRVVFLISGGGSALITLPRQGITMEDIQETTGVLLDNGVPIGAINTIRKHLDRVKGGGLLGQVLEAKTLTLILSDVSGGPLDAVASGPTLPDDSTFADCVGIIREHGIERKMPAWVLEYLKAGAQGKHLETLKAGSVDPARHYALPVGSLDMAIEEARQVGKKTGYNVKKAAQYLSGDINAEAERVMEEFNQFCTGTVERGWLMVWGGEVVVTRKGDHAGGRNLQLALLLAQKISGNSGLWGFTFATDGEDGSSNAAGAIFGENTGERIKQTGLEITRLIEEQDNLTAFQAAGGLIATGSTGTNVNDILVIVKEKNGTAEI